MYTKAVLHRFDPPQPPLLSYALVASFLTKEDLTGVEEIGETSSQVWRCHAVAADLAKLFSRPVRHLPCVLKNHRVGQSNAHRCLSWGMIEVAVEFCESCSRALATHG